MSKKIKDYLHLYIGVECIADETKFKLHGVEFTDTGTLAYDGTMIDGIHQCWWIENCDFKLVLRKLSSMTDEEWKDVFRLATGIYSDSVINDFRKMATSEISVRQGFAQYSLSHHTCYDNDVRLGYSVAFSMTKYKVLNKLNVTPTGINERQSEFNEPELVIVKNQSLIFRYLLSKGFDLFNLIESGAAIDKDSLV